MAMTASSRAPQGAGTQESERSPFARVAELLAPHQPGKPLIALSLGEPQHPIPAFVGPVLAKAGREMEVQGRPFPMDDVGVFRRPSRPSGSEATIPNGRSFRSGGPPDGGLVAPQLFMWRN